MSDVMLPPGAISLRNALELGAVLEESNELGLALFFPDGSIDRVNRASRDALLRRDMIRSHRTTRTITGKQYRLVEPEAMVIVEELGPRAAASAASSGEVRESHD